MELIDPKQFAKEFERTINLAKVQIYIKQYSYGTAERIDL